MLQEVTVSQQEITFAERGREIAVPSLKCRITPLQNSVM